MTRHLAALSLMLLSTLQLGVTAEGMIKKVDVPKLSFAGERINISCLFDLENTGLYSLKWYHNDAEFYRYIPTEEVRPVNIQSGLKFNVYEISRTSKEVVLELASLTSAATGEFKCEVIAEHPSFRTKKKSANMTVIEDPLLPPVIEGGRETYEEEDIIKLSCFPQRLLSKKYSYSMDWRVGGKAASKEFVEPFSHQAVAHLEGTKFTAPVHLLMTSGKYVNIECRLTLNDFDVDSFRAIKVEIKKSNFFANYWSTGNALEMSWTCAALFLVKYFV